MQNIKVAGIAMLLVWAVAGGGIAQGADEEGARREIANQQEKGTATSPEKLQIDASGEKSRKEQEAEYKVQAAKSRALFLQVERFARLPEAEQSKGLAQFYRELPSRAMSPFVEGILSSYPTNILDRRPENGFQGNTELWAKQLAESAATHTPEEVDSKLDYLFRQVATRARAIQVLKVHEKEIGELLRADLKSVQKSDSDRAIAMITAMRTKAFNTLLLTKLETETQDMVIFQIRDALWASEDPNLLPMLRARVEKDPKYLAKCTTLFEMPLQNKPADPLLLKLLDSDDAEIRYHAGEAVYDCIDPKLAAGAVQLVQAKDPKHRQVGAHLAGNLGGEEFLKVRKDLLPLLEDKNREVLVEGLVSFAKHKDVAAGPVLLKLLKEKEGGPGGQSEQIRGAFQLLTDEDFQKVFKYDFQQWGPDLPGNGEAIKMLEKWVEMQKKMDVEK